MIRVLLVDDEIQLIEAFKTQLTEDGMEVSIASSGYEALSLTKKRTFDVAVLDIKLPDLDGVNLLLKLKQMEPTLEVIMLTGFASVDTAIRSMKLGAYDYLTKPCKIAELHKVVIKAYENKTLKERNAALSEQLQRMAGHQEFVGASTPMEKVKKLVALVAPSNMPVLITGETGTGKELAARAIHKLSPRRESAFIPINASTLQETILESELFGYKKGAFTGALDNKLGLLDIANHGTLFIDEVGDMGPMIQAKLLRVLETGAFMKLGDTKETRVDVRLIFATNKDLKGEVEVGRFRKDLFFRVNGFTIDLPPLREKRDDIADLSSYFLEKFGRGGGKRFHPGAMKLLRTYDWPGNVRELANVIERAVLLSLDRPEITEDDLPEGLLRRTTKAARTGFPPAKGGALDLAHVEEEHIQSVLDSVNGNRSRAARLLGISRRTLQSRIARLSKPRFSEEAGRR